MAEVKAFFEELKAIFSPFLPYAPLLLTIWGWGVANRAAADRDIRKERRAEVDACCKLASDLVEKARDYYTTAPTAANAGKLEQDVSFLVHRLVQRVERLGRNCSKMEIGPTLEELHEAITGGDFQSANRVVLAHSDPKLDRIQVYTHALIDNMEEGFSNSFR